MTLYVFTCLHKLKSWYFYLLYTIEAKFNDFENYTLLRIMKVVSSISEYHKKY